MKPALLAGTVVSYLGINAVVIEDGPTEFLVLCEGNHESWWWECHGHTCEIVAYPSGSTHYHQPAPDVQGEPVGSGWMLFPKAAWDFLYGTGELNGFGFGDRPKGQPPFWWRLVIRKMLDSAPQPAGQQPKPISRNLRAVHAMILNALDRDAADGKAVRGEMAAELRSALSEQQPAACVGCEGAPEPENSPCAVCGQQLTPDVAEEWSRAFLQIAVVLEALTSSDSDERLSRINAADVLGEAFGTLVRIRRVVSTDVAGLVDALEGALDGRPLDTEFWDRCEQFIATHRKGGE